MNMQPEALVQQFPGLAGLQWGDMSARLDDEGFFGET
jgi:hypothetical protein